MNQTKKYPKGTFIVLGMLMGIPISVALAIGTKTPGLIGIGPALGLPIGMAWEEQQKKAGKIATSNDQGTQKKILLFLLLLGLVFMAGILVALFVY